MVATSLLPGFIDYVFIDGDWRYHDSYTGRRFPPRKEVIFFRNIPVWCMSYQGKISDNLDEGEVDLVYSFLKKALRKTERRTPFWDPARFSEGDIE